MQFLKLPPERRAEIFAQVAARTGFPLQAVEKDWWATQALRAIFSTEYAPDILFKGGTSLSKGYGLIDRFSEDVDLAINPKVLGFEGELSNTQIVKLRKKAFEFVSGPFRDALKSRMLQLGFSVGDFVLSEKKSDQSDTDPQAAGCSLWYTTAVNVRNTQY